MKESAVLDVDEEQVDYVLHEAEDEVEDVKIL